MLACVSSSSTSRHTDHGEYHNCSLWVLIYILFVSMKLLIASTLSLPAHTHNHTHTEASADPLNQQNTDGKVEIWPVIQWLLVLELWTQSSFSCLCVSLFLLPCFWSLQSDSQSNKHVGRSRVRSPLSQHALRPRLTGRVTNPALSVILSQKTLMTNLCCFGNIFYLIFGRTVELKHNQDYLINFILLMAKFYVLKCLCVHKFSCKKPNFILFRKEIELYIDSLWFSLKQKAIKTLKICKCYNIFI